MNFGLITVDDGDSAAIVNGSEAILIENGVERIHGFLLGQRLTAPELDFAANGRAGLDVNDETGSVAEVMKNLLQRDIAEVQAQTGFAVGDGERNSVAGVSGRGRCGRLFSNSRVCRALGRGIGGIVDGLFSRLN